MTSEGPQHGEDPRPPVEWSVPDRTVDPAPEAGDGLVVASVWARLGALVVDDLLILVVSFVVAIALGFVLAVGGISSSSPESTLVGALVVEIAIAGYFVIGWRTSHQATPGLRLIGLRVIHATEGRTLTPSEAVRRWAFLYGPAAVLALLPGSAGSASGISLVWFVVLLITTAADPRHQGLHDRFAPSVVVRPAGARTSGAAMAVVVLALVLLLVLIVGVVGLIFLGQQIRAIGG